MSKDADVRFRQAVADLRDHLDQFGTPEELQLLRALLDAIADDA